MELPTDPAGRITGKEVVRLMRVWRVSIRDLKIKTGITMKRIRQVRESGTTDGFHTRDWVQAITGTDPGRLGPPDPNYR
jgi:hypothetical protein